MDIPVFVRKNIHQKYSYVKKNFESGSSISSCHCVCSKFKFSVEEYSKSFKGEISMLVGSKVQLIATLDQEIIADKHVSVMLYTGTLSCGPTFVSLISNFSQGAM